VFYRFYEFSHISSLHFIFKTNTNEPLTTQTFLILISLEKIEEEYERMNKKIKMILLRIDGKIDKIIEELD
jgi:hypothetical protein